MAKRGDLISISLDGTKFTAPKETEVEIIRGGEMITDTQDYADGTSDSIVTMVIPKITGCKVKVDDEDLFYKKIKTPDIPIIVECVGKSYELTGSVVGEVTVNNKNISSDFELRATDGNGIRQS
jgi:hypothetical protein